ncbi:MAG: hypothetical protein H6867_03810 [Rhodospirillales bacterium]|nr:hypothetical protein [Rhodospirillales bacterium]MCB9996276.1 hypothetical protein [Rhodospirillales bacterium]
MEYYVSLEGFAANAKGQSHVQFKQQAASNFNRAVTLAQHYAIDPHGQITEHPLKENERLGWVALLFNDKAQGIEDGIAAGKIEQLRPDLFRYKLYIFS